MEAGKSGSLNKKLQNKNSIATTTNPIISEDTSSIAKTTTLEPSISIASGGDNDCFQNETEDNHDQSRSTSTAVEQQNLANVDQELHAADVGTNYISVSLSSMMTTQPISLV